MKIISRFLLLVLLLAILAYVLLMNLNKDDFVKQDKEELQKTGPSTTSVEAHTTESFERLLASENKRVLEATYSKYLEYDEDGRSVAVRLDRIDKRLKISEKMLALSDSDEEKISAFKRLVQTRIDRVILAMEIRNDVWASRESLELTLNQFAESKLQEIDEVPLSEFVVLTSKLFDASFQERLALNQQVIAKLQETSFAENFYHISRVKQLLDLYEDRIGGDIVTSFAQRLVACYDGKALASDLFVHANEVIQQAEFEFVSVSNAVASEIETLSAKLSAQIKEILENQIPSNQLFARIRKHVEELASVGQIELATELVDYVENKVDEKDLPNQPWVQALQKRLRHVNSVYDLTGLKTVDGDQANFSTPDSPFKIILFVAPESHRESVFYFAKILEMLSQTKARDLVEFAIIYIYTDEKAPNTIKMREMANAETFFDVWFLSMSTVSAMKRLEEFPIESTPYMIVLDSDNKVIHLNPELENLKTVFEVQALKSNFEESKN